MCAELQLFVLSFTVHRDRSGSLLLASHPLHPHRLLCPAPPPPPHALPHPLQAVDFSLDAKFGCNFNEVLFLTLPPFVIYCP